MLLEAQCGDLSMGSEKSSYTRVITIVDKTGIKVLCIMLAFSDSAGWRGVCTEIERSHQKCAAH
jgi:hypothetical protein